MSGRRFPLRHKRAHEAGSRRTGVFSIVREFLEILTPRERHRGLVVLGMLLLLALLDTVGVASVMPFLAVLGNPEMVDSNPALARVYELGGFTSVDSFLVALAVGAFLLIVSSAVFRILTTYAINRYTHMRRYSIGVRLLRTYLRQPYAYFLDRNSADLSKSILSEVDTLAHQVIRPAMNFISYAMVSLLLVTFLVWLDPVVALVVSLGMLGAYALIYVSIRGHLNRSGVDRLKANRERFTAASEAFGGIKDLKVMGREGAYVGRFRAPAARFSRHVYRFMTLSAAPKYLIEAGGFGGIMALAIYLMSTRADLGEVLPILGLYAFAAYRLLPAFQQMYQAVSALRFGLPAVDAIAGDMRAKEGTAERISRASPPMRLERSIRFEDVSFRYPRASDDALRDLDLTIQARTSVAFVGRTGAGKTTAADLILGLLMPTEGRILVDGTELTASNLGGWQKTIGYVPQGIYLADASISENIAFGLDRDEIDPEAVERAARIANIDTFIREALPEGYDTEVGERGVRISGGQRQRIGIARALYHDPSLLVLDEATSALDTETESAIMEAVEKLSGETTIVMIAHRMSTVKACDDIIMLEGGRILARGTYGELRETNPAFRKLAIV